MALEATDTTDGAASAFDDERIEDRSRRERGLHTRVEKHPCFGELGIDVAGCKQSEVAHLDEAWRKQMQEKPAKEFGRRDRDGLAVLRAKRDGIVVESKEATVGDADTVGVAPEIAIDLLRTSKSALGVDDPVLLRESAHEAIETFGILERIKAREETACVGLAESVEELAAKESADDFDGEEVLLSRVDPTMTIE